MSETSVYDVVIVGGAVTGSSVACHLAAEPGFSGRIAVIEKDPSYQRCASALSAASIRQQYSTAINVAISMYGIEFLRAIGDRLEVNGDRPEIGLVEQGYLFLATEAGRDVLVENHAVQIAGGADVVLEDPAELVARFPWLNVEDIVAGSFGRSGEGWFDGYGLMQAFRRKARSLGVDYLADTAVSVSREGDRITGLGLASGRTLSVGALVNAAGGGGAALARAAGLDIPIHVKKRMIFTFSCADRVERCPLMIDPTGVYVRADGRDFLCGWQPPEDQDPDVVDDFDVDYSFFEDGIWPILANRVPAFERIRQKAAWAGYYDMNLFDHNAFVGQAPGYANFYLANGFSGHGLQQSPAVGRGLAELIADGQFRTLDLSPLSPARMLENRPLIEKNIV